jgi:hypothetical protein
LSLLKSLKTLEPTSLLLRKAADKVPVLVLDPKLMIKEESALLEEESK